MILCATGTATLEGNFTPPLSWIVVEAVAVRGEGEVPSWPVPALGLGQVSCLLGLEGGLALGESVARPALGPEGEGGSGLTWK